MTEIKINTKKGENGALIATAFKFGEDTTPEQSFKEVVDAVVMFARLNAEAAQKTGLEVTWLDVLDKLLLDLTYERVQLEDAIKNGKIKDFPGGDVTD